MDRSLRELAEELTALGEEAFRAKHTVPVLICRDVDDDDERSFHTEMASRADLFDTVDGAARPTPGAMVRPTLPRMPVLDELPEQSGERAYYIVKRADGAFQDRVGVGRAPNVDVSIGLPRLSKYHAYFVLPEDPAGDLTIADAGSKNGTWVDGDKVEPKQSVPVTDGCTVRLGPYYLTYHTPEGLLDLVRKHAARTAP